MERNIAARAGRWSATHRKRAIWGWLAFVFLALFIGESGAAAQTIRNATAKHADEMVLVQSQSTKATDLSFRALVGQVQRRLGAVPYTQRFESPYARGNQGQISTDGHS